MLPAPASQAPGRPVAPEASAAGSDTAAPAAGEHAAAPGEDRPAVGARRSKAGLGLAIGVLGFLLLAGGEAYLFIRTQAGADAARQVAALKSEMGVLQRQLGQLRTAQAAAPPQGAAASAGQAVPQASSAQASGAQPAGGQPATGQASANAQPANDPAVAALDVKFGNLAAQVNALQSQLASDHGALTALQATSGDLSKLLARVRLLAALEDARMALDAGQPLGDIPGAPSALGRFAERAPPTEAQLRLSFPAAARKAEAASVTENGKGGYWSSVLARLENVVTVSHGTQVVVGAPAAGVIVQARAQLDAGDLAAAVRMLETLSAPTQAAMAGWLDQAKALLAARQALLGMANQA
ncbi:MAG: hypothetical protein B7Z80_04090 [Rhodospirillales bacterium 20-64-7]|nr:MAG: hypothetical protein B7Z80_04090 [Rhodospirillales bacterium 20-64-7]